MESLLVPGVEFGGYRSIDASVRLAPLAKFTALAGRNNSGKSNVLKFLLEHYSSTLERLYGRQTVQRSGAMAWGSDPIGGSGEHSFAVCMPFDSEFIRRVAATAVQGSELGVERARALVDCFESDGHLGIWEHWNTSGQGAPTRVPGLASDRSALSKLLTAYSNQLQIPRLSNPLLSKFEFVPPAMLSQPPVLISAFRELTPESQEADAGARTGAGTVERLADLRSPNLGSLRAAKQGRWRAFLRFVRTVLEQDTVEVEIPATDQNRLIVTMNGREQEIEDLGTGIHEVVILAAEATALDNRVVLLEEPEIHLHPLLQRRLCEYLVADTSNQYVVATHSAHVLDTPGASIFNVSLEESWTRVQPVNSNSGRIRATRDLGYRPSDLLQTNLVIWVEGPSDRIYLSYWLHEEAPHLREGVDYAIMFYGGALLAHTSGVDSEFQLEEGDLVELRRLSRRSAILIDSDRPEKGKHLKANARRIQSEFSDGHVWVTQGREVENYVECSDMLQAIESVHENVHSLDDDGDFGQRWKYRSSTPSGRRGQKSKSANKVKVAREVVSSQPAMDVLDLRSQLKSLVRYIEQA